jgi:mRNA-degrading endonuclease toxin of MazEF toxin-antitoxin module
MALTETSPLEAGEIYWITIASKAGREQEGRRPCIVMSRKAINSGNPVVVVPMSTNLKKHNSYNITIPAAEIVKDVNSKSTTVDSVALCGLIFAVDKRKFEERFGKLSHLATVPSVPTSLRHLQ